MGTLALEMSPFQRVPSEGVTEEAAQSLHAGESGSKATVGLDGALSSVGRQAYQVAGRQAGRLAGI